MSSQSPDSTNPKSTYSAQSIRVMEGLEAVRKRPGMYIGTTGPAGLHHLVYEVVDNSVDEALGGHCDTITVTLHEDGSCSVQDNGRGIPTEIHQEEGISAAEVVLTKLHAGGKFDKDSYRFSGGLHGVGVSVVNALSSLLHITIYRNGNIYTQEYRQGKPINRLTEIGTTEKRGTLVQFLPDAEIFKETTEFSFDRLASRFRELTFLNKGLRITILDERNNEEESFLFEGGIVSFVQHINKKKSPLTEEIIYHREEGADYDFECALQYNNGYDEQLYSFVNNINTADGGTHVAGFKAALTKACNKRAQELNLLKKDISFSSEDVREGLVCVLSIKIPEPQFEGQTKGKLGNSEVKGLVSSWAFAFLDKYFEENPTIAKKILQKAVITMQARDAARKARDLTRRKNVLESTVLPGKLADCSLEEPAKCELFIVEGDSAGGSAKSARDRFTQAILPLKGKILNVEKARLDKALANEEIKALIAAVGGGVNEETFDASRIRYHKIILMTDADVDGSHIRTLLLTFFFRYMCPVLNLGYIYIAQPPLYKVKIGRKEQYLKDERAFTAFLLDWAGEHTNLLQEPEKLEADAWKDLLAKILIYESQLDGAARVLHLSDSETDMIVDAIAQSNWLTIGDLASLVNATKQHLPHCTIEMSEESEVEALIIAAQDGAWKTRVPLKALKRNEVASLIETKKAIAQLSTPWTIQIQDTDKTFSGSSPRQIIIGIRELSKPSMNVQRYKGLGEMNPEQLWETAMDPATRSLLKVSIDDAVKADQWFSTLMGDDVQGRKIFIEERGKFAKNLDV